MIKYVINYGKTENTLLDISYISDEIHASETFLQLPAWRPGRYELGNFAQYVFPIQVKDQDGNSLAYKKITKDSWQIFHLSNTKSIRVNYQFSAEIKNAGGTFKSANNFVITPVNCLIYNPKTIDNPCIVEIVKPEEFILYSSIKNNTCVNYYELAASPIVCGSRIQSETIRIQNKNFHIVFEGDVHPNWQKIVADFSLFIQEQLNLFGHFPSKDYYFLNLIFEESHYHGVEHLESTLIALGPNTDFDKKEFYQNLLGISCHELFHYWNICRIRPKEMSPYDYTKENYFETGYIAEGVTTYYGDYLLGRSGAISEEECLDELSATISRHLNNPARHVASLAASSIDLWLDGYKAGVSGRKVSIYAKGACIAFLLDLWVRKNTANKKSLDDVMRLLWENHGLTNQGYTSKDYQNYIEKISATSAKDYFEDYVFGTKLIETEFIPLLEDFGLSLIQEKKENKDFWKLQKVEKPSLKQRTNYLHWINKKAK